MSSFAFVLSQTSVIRLLLAKRDIKTPPMSKILRASPSKIAYFLLSNLQNTVSFKL